MQAQKENTTFETLVGESIGEASMCWSETPTGVFESTKAKNIVDKILNSSNKQEKERLLMVILKNAGTMTQDYKNLINHTGGLLKSSMGYAYAKGIQDVIKLLTTEKEGKNESV